MTRTGEELLQLWFGDLQPELPAPGERLRFWFGGGEAVDRLLRERFTTAVTAAADGAYQAWGATARGRLALILLLDQLPRNIYRDSPRAYASDAQARQQTLEGLAAGQDRSLAIVERAFFYLPLEHAEDSGLQEQSVTLFTDLLATAAPAQRQMCRDFLDYAERHRDVIARFGRFPHRNAVLGRSSTAAEKAFLNQPGSSF